MLMLCLHARSMQAGVGAACQPALPLPIPTRGPYVGIPGLTVPYARTVPVPAMSARASPAAPVDRRVANVPCAEWEAIRAEQTPAEWLSMIAHVGPPT